MIIKYILKDFKGSGKIIIVPKGYSKNASVTSKKMIFYASIN
jgi:hypothetical protein